MLRAVSSPLSIAHVWRGEELAQSSERTLPSGHAQLDACLPGAGWPLGSLIEILQAQPQQHAWQLLLPALAQASQASQGEAGPIVLVGPPFEPFGPSLQAQGLSPARLLRVDADKSAARLWAAEQALRCAEVAAVVAWLPRSNANELRRLHMAAQQHGRLLFVFRTLHSRSDASPARLRLMIEGAQELQVRILKRRGPPLLEAVSLPAQPPRLAALLRSRKSALARDAAVFPSSRSRSDVLDRTAAHA
ncbi:MAG TPA: translesion DNA synthesis-associated protein ImuA [Ramlibacter sp.]|uniref:translesion DNA synthesis-associated protein ImuA n=1 Tax=Ramlibacter sp. TaxID=1917967 RepID=UPI002CF0DEBD|nr:translesion DNA synthesis-associated protein ImuA [Ramlibacter sp.]HVZ43378.1 translesion DNA synthesis-associated protein ImuA [Ramlibacter sp.]